MDSVFTACSPPSSHKRWPGGGGGVTYQCLLCPCYLKSGTLYSNEWPTQKDILELLLVCFRKPKELFVPFLQSNFVLTLVNLG